MLFLATLLSHKEVVHHLHFVSLLLLLFSFELFIRIIHLIEISVLLGFFICPTVEISILLWILSIMLAEERFTFLCRFTCRGCAQVKEVSAYILSGRDVWLVSRYMKIFFRLPSRFFLVTCRCPLFPSAYYWPCILLRIYAICETLWAFS